MQDFFRHVNEVRIIYHPFCFVFFNFKSILNQLSPWQNLEIMFRWDSQFTVYVIYWLTSLIIPNITDLLGSFSNWLTVYCGRFQIRWLSLPKCSICRLTRCSADSWCCSEGGTPVLLAIFQASSSRRVSCMNPSTSPPFSITCNCNYVTCHILSFKRFLFSSRDSITH